MTPLFAYALPMFLFAGLAKSDSSLNEEACFFDDRSTCVDMSTAKSIHANAMLQVNAAPPKTSAVQVQAKTRFSSRAASISQLQKSRACLPKGLQEIHLRAVRRHAALLTIASKQGPLPPTVAPEGILPPTIAPSDIPAEALSETPTEQDVPAEPPADAINTFPTEPPIDAPTEPPTDAPTEPPTEAPTELPSDAPAPSAAKIVEITFPGTLSSLTEAQQNQMKSDVLAALPALTGITYNIELLSGSIIAKVTITGTGNTENAATRAVATTPISVVVDGQTVTSTGAAVVAVGSASGAEGLAPTDAPAGLDGATASLDAAGFLQVTKLCCPVEMEVFFMRLLDSMGYFVCSKPHIQGLMHWFSCVPDMNFEYMIQVIEQGNPCKFWAPTGNECPILSPECEGKWCR